MKTLGFAILLSVSLLVACTPVEPPRNEAERHNSQQLHAIFDDYFTADLRLEPLKATYLGDTRYNHLLPNTLSEEHRIRRRMLEEEFLAALETVDVEYLSESDKLSYRLFKAEREQELEALQYPRHLMALNQFYNLANQLAMLGSGTSAQPFQTVRDYENWARRMEQIPELLAQLEANLRVGIAEEIVQPRVLMERVQAQIQAHLVDEIEDSLFFQPILNFPEALADADKERLSQRYDDLIRETVLPAYQQLNDFVLSEYIPAARTETYGIGVIDPEWYNYKIRWRTTTNMSATEIHQLGLSDVARIHDAIRQVMVDVEFDGSMEEFFAFTRDDEQFIYESREAMLEDYRAFARLAESRAQALFHADMLPRADYEVRKVEAFREQSASSGSYSVPSEDGSRPGIFYLNTYDLSARPKWAKGALTLHEAVPGHHYQLALQREMTDLPTFRRFGGETAFIEGWGLYAESLGDELGVYEPYDRYGALVAELWRSIRLVVDTGIHAKGWSRQQVLDYMYENAPVAEARAVSEAERYMALPGQALAYKIGQIKIRELRTRAEEALGQAFDPRDFHREILRHGSLPLFILEELIEQWIAETQGEMV